jgi:hypothetical protein
MATADGLKQRTNEWKESKSNTDSQVDIPLRTYCKPEMKRWWHLQTVRCRIRGNTHSANRNSRRQASIAPDNIIGKKIKYFHDGKTFKALDTSALFNS